MRLYDIDLTEEEYYSYYIHEDDDNVDINFQDTEITISSEAFDKLKEDILEQERLIKREDSATIEMDGKFSSKRETLLKELIKTTDEINDLTNRYDSTYFTLMEDRACPSFKDDLEVRNKLRPMWEKRNNLMNYREKLEAQLKYGEFQ